VKNRSEILRLPAELESLERFREYVTAKALENGLDDRLLPKIELVIEEVLTNLVKYAYKDRGGEAEVACFPRPDGCFCLQLTDWGAAFDPLKLPEPDTSAPMEERQVGGLGIHLVKKMAHHLEYRREDGKNILTVCFKNPAT
jgi:anti-sigma regulatory factor (Ser/Thr protein kinase)